MANGPKLHGEPGNERFTEKQWLFINALIGEARGNGLKAATLAGYAAPGQEAHRLLKNAEIRKAIDELFETSPLIASRNERLCFLTRVVRGEEPDYSKEGLPVLAGLRTRIHAAEVMASMQGDLKLNVDLKQEINIKDEREALDSMIDNIASKQAPASEGKHVH